MMFLRAMALICMGSLAAQAQTAATMATQAVAPCGPEAPCETATGSYHLLAPPEWKGATELPVLFFFHGHRASGRMIFRSGGLQSAFADQGWLVVAPNGVAIPDTKVFAWPGRTPTAGGRDDVSFVLEVLEDLRGRFPVRTDAVYASGFSAGGSMAWMLACHAPDDFAGFAAVAGTLRAPQPAPCATDAVRLIQIHGFADNQVPFEGRAIRNWHQGDLFAALADLRGRNRCRSHPDRIEMGERYRCRIWDDSCGDGALHLCEHDGGHGLPRGWTDLARAFFENP